VSDPAPSDTPCECRAAFVEVSLGQNLIKTRKKWCDHYANEDGRITAWMFVPPGIVSEILDGQIQECPADLAEDSTYFKIAYDWMKESMDSAGLPGRKPGITPWWCWISLWGERVKPSAEGSQPGDVLLELSLPKDQLLLSDFYMWHAPLNYWCMLDEPESTQFEAELAAADLSLYDDVPVPEPFHSRVQAGWNQIFSLDLKNDFTYDFEAKTIQGVFWSLRPEFVVGVVEPAESVEEPIERDECEE